MSARRLPWPRTLLGRHLALLVLLIVAGQIGAGLLVFSLAMLPRVQQAADGMAAQVQALRAGVEGLAPAERLAFAQRFNGALTAQASPGAQEGAPTGLERRFLQALAQRLSTQGAAAVSQPAWRRDAQGRLWVHAGADASDPWLAMPRLLALDEARGAWLAALAAGLLLALAGVWRLQRLLAAPLQQLMRAAQDVAAGRPPLSLPETGPRELATVGTSFNRMVQALTSAERERALMLAGISHDLRTPLTKLRLAIDIAGTHLEPELAASMTRSVDGMTAIVMQFLDFARTGEGDALTLESVDALAMAVAQAQQDLGRLVQLQLGDATPCHVHPLWLRRAIDNLVENAWRHGAPPVVLRTGCDSGSVWIEVQDHGSGVAAADLERIRQPFVRAGTAAQGTGLGLAIAERAALAHGGALQLESAPGQGLRARIRLPLA